MRAAIRAQPPADIQDAAFLVDTVLHNAACAMRAVVHRTFKTTPGALVFNRDMMLDIPLIADLLEITARRQQLIDQRTIEANRRRISHDCQPNEEVLVLTHKPHKLAPRATGPCTVERVHVNGTVTLRVSPYIAERVNIRRIKPHRH